MSFQCDLGIDTSREPLRGTFPVQEPDREVVDQQSTFQPATSGSLPPVRAGTRTKSVLESFLHCAPVRCIEAVARFLDLPSFVALVTLNSSLLRLCDSSALQPSWTHFALVQRILRHGENVLLPRLSPTSLPLLRGSEGGGGGRSGTRGNGGSTNREGDTETVSPCQTFSRLLPRVTRLDLVRIGSLNSNWRNKSFSTEQRQVICSGEALDKAYVLPTPPLESSFSEYSVAPDAQLNLQACPLVGLPACLQPPGARHFMDGTPLFTVLPSTRIFAVHAAARAPRGQSVEVKLPVLPAKIPVEPDPLIKFGSYAPKGWLLGDDDIPLQVPPAIAAGVSGSATRISQSQRKRQQRQQRQQQLHRLHMSWVHIVPHPLRPCPRDGARGGELVRRSSREGSPLLSAASSAFKFSSNVPCLLDSGAPPVRDTAAEEGLGHCPLVRLLCLCLPTIEIENAPSAEGCTFDGGKPGECKEESGIATTDAEPQQQSEGSPSLCAASGTCGSVERGAVPPAAPADNVATTGAATVTPCCVVDDEGEPPAVPPPVPPSVATPQRRDAPSRPGRIWPVALCSYSPKGARFLAHAIVCCALREGETVKSARSRLWYKEKRQDKALWCGSSCGALTSVDEEISKKLSSASANGGRPLPTHSELPTAKTTSSKAISFSMQQHPQAVFVGMVAVGTSEGRILCTPPPRCLVRRCYCGKGCLATLRAEGSRGPYGGSCGSQYVQSAVEANGVRPSDDGQEPQACTRLPHPLQATACSAVPLAGTATISSSPPAVTAAKAGRGVAFFEVGHFGEGGGAVDYVELVRGTPWAPRMRQRDQPQLLIPTQQRDFSWHWTRPPTAAAEGRMRVDASSAECMPASSASCGGLEAEALWLFACSKEAGLKIFRFIWSVQEGGVSKRTVAGGKGLHGACGTWRCVFTVRGSWQLVSLDLNNGIIAMCTPTDSRVFFICFRHLLPAHIYLSNTTQPPAVSAEDLANFGRCRLPRPHHVPLCGYLATQQQQFTSVLQSPAECARFELLVARRPSFLQPLGGRRWVVIDGAVIRVVQVKVRDRAVQRKAPDAAQQELLQATLTGTPTEQLRQLRRPVVEERELPWLLGPPPAPNLQTVRLCVFSHPRTIYQCAFDGVRRLVTIDLQEVLMVWDLQRYTKLFDVDLMASGESHSRGRSDTQEAEGCGGDGGDICMSSDGICSENEHEATIRRSVSRRGGGSGGHSEVGLTSARAVRKAGKLSLKKQFGSGWMQKQVLAHRTNTQQQQGRRSVYSTGYSTNSATDVGGSRAGQEYGDGVCIGGVWFNTTSLEPALHLQLLYDTQKEAGNARSLASSPPASVEQPPAPTCNGITAEASTVNLELAGDSSGEASKLNVGTATPGCETARVPDDDCPLAFYGAERAETVDQELSAAMAVCYADDFPPLSTPYEPTQMAEEGKRYHSPRDRPATPPLPLAAAPAPQNLPAASAAPEGTQLSGGPSPPCGDNGARGAVSTKGENFEQQPSGLDGAKISNPLDGGRPSFAAVVAAAASSSSGSCQRTGWASGPTDPSLLVGLLGEEGARALQESAAALGVTTEELYIQQVVQWEQVQQRACRRARTEGSLTSLDLGRGSDRATNSNGHLMAAADARHEAVQQPSPVLHCVGDGLERSEHPKDAEAGETALPPSDADSSRGSKTSRSPSTNVLLGSPHGSPLLESAPAASPRLRPLHAQMVQGSGSHSESRLVGLLGRQRCVARLGPNAQQRHVTAVCLSETCMALLFKNLKTWQIWAFAPSAGSTPSMAGDASTEWML